MDQSYLRSILLRIVDRLSFNDRQKLHLILSEHIPRRIRDDISHNGTLHLMESLLDQNKINEKNLTLLINALETIHCFDLIKFLTEYLKQNQLKKKLSLSMSSMIGEQFEDRDENDRQKSDMITNVIERRSTDLTTLTKSLEYTRLNDKLSDDNDHMYFEGKCQTECLNKFQFIVIDVANRLDEISLAMLKTLQSMIKESLLIIEHILIIDFDTLIEKNTFLFISSEFAEKITRQPKQIKAIFILENDSNKVDYEKRFDNGLDLIFQLADEIYRCYMEKAREYFQVGDQSTVNIIEECANRIHRELKKIYNSMSKNDRTIIKPMNTTTAVVWVKIKEQQTTSLEEIQQLVSSIIRCFSVFNDLEICEKYLLENKSISMILIIINSDHLISMEIDFHQFSNVKIIYYYENNSVKNEGIITKYNDLCFRLIVDLATHYNSLGSICSVKHDFKIAKDMFFKAYELYNILANLQEFQ